MIKTNKIYKLKTTISYSLASHEFNSQHRLENSLYKNELGFVVEKYYYSVGSEEFCDVKFLTKDKMVWVTCLTEKYLAEKVFEEMENYDL